MITLLATKHPHDFDGRADLIEGRHIEDAGLLDVLDALVGLPVQQGIQHQSCLVLILAEVVALAHLVGPLFSGQRGLAVGDVADEIEGIRVLADPFLQSLPEQAGSVRPWWVQ